jgi:hypothetical protein
MRYWIHFNFTLTLTLSLKGEGIFAYTLIKRGILINLSSPLGRVFYSSFLSPAGRGLR